MNPLTCLRWSPCNDHTLTLLTLQSQSYVNLVFVCAGHVFWTANWNSAVNDPGCAGYRHVSLQYSTWSDSGGFWFRYGFLTWKSGICGIMLHCSNAFACHFHFLQSPTATMHHNTFGLHFYFCKLLNTCLEAQWSHAPLGFPCTRNVSQTAIYSLNEANSFK